MRDQRCGELARRLGRDVHGQPSGFVANPFALPGLDQRHRKPAQRRAVAHPQGLPLARREDGAAPAKRDAAALLMTEQNFRKIMGYRDLWMLKGALDRKGVLPQRKVA
jgi:hypothetical protein